MYLKTPDRVSFIESLKINYTICEEKDQFIQSKRETKIDSVPSNICGEWPPVSSLFIALL